MFRLAARSLTRTSALRASTIAPSAAIRFYSAAANGLSTSEIIRRITESNSHLIKAKSDLSAETKLTQDLGLDSLDSTEFLVNVENEFDFQLSDEDSEKIKTIGQIIEIVASNPQAS